MSRILICCGALVPLAAATAQAAVLDISIPAQGANYNNMVRDAKLRGDGGLDNANLGNGAGDSNRFYANFLADNTTPSVGRANTFLQWFDVSSIPAGSIINSATLKTGFGNFSANNRTWTNVKLSRLQPSKDWIEGVGQNPATDGSPTWNHQKANTVPWATAGALGAADIDMGATTQVFDVVGVDGSGTTITRDITTFVQGWVNTPASNNGMLWYAGGNADSASGNRAFRFGTKEDGNVPADENVGGAPSLLINYTLVPEPTAALLLAGGLALVVGGRRRPEACK